MTKLDAVIERLKALPRDRQEGVAYEIEALLEPDPVLTPEQWAELDRRMSDPNDREIPHEEVVAHMRAKYGD